jgi:hypothetical protein
MEAQSLIKDLQVILHHLASQNNISIIPDFATYQSRAEQSRNLTLESLRLLANRLNEAPTSMLSLASTFSSSSMSPYTSMSSSAFLQPLVLARTLLNIQNICKNAQLYRENRSDFEQLTRRVSQRPHDTWACTHCDIEVSRVSLALPTPGDELWINAAGMLQAHCARSHSHQNGWTCIWVKTHGNCAARFANERDLLVHMHRCHVIFRGNGSARSASVDWAADISMRGVNRCGFGVSINGRLMQEGDSSFVVPDSAS